MQEEAQPEIPIEFKVDLTDQHPTQHKYAFWFHRRGNKSSVNYDNYGVKLFLFINSMIYIYIFFC
jgi:hypothetical protein